MKVSELIRLLEEDGWRLARTRGSHRQYKNPNKPATVTVAGKPSLDVPPGTLNSITEAGGSEEDGRWRMMRYMVVIERGETSWGAHVPDLPGCVAIGETREEVLRLIREAIELHIDGLKGDGLPVPTPSSEGEIAFASRAARHEQPSAWHHGMSDTLRRVQDLVQGGTVRVSAHGYDEMAEDGILESEVIDGLGAAVVVEDYPAYLKGPCTLVLQRDRHGSPIHVVWASREGSRRRRCSSLPIGPIRLAGRTTSCGGRNEQAEPHQVSPRGLVRGRGGRRANRSERRLVTISLAR
jgi:predicted RNA binding protein YcfA (HicA-like mRNA interferase family)/predicted RNase H-like HicB family nuclease